MIPTSNKTKDGFNGSISISNNQSKFTIIPAIPITIKVNRFSNSLDSPVKNLKTKGKTLFTKNTLDTKKKTGVSIRTRSILIPSNRPLDII